MDKILIRGLKVFAYHGVGNEEKLKGQNFELDIDIYSNLKRAGNSDNLDDTVNYSKVSKLVVEIVQRDSHNLLEKAATAVAKGILMEFDFCDKVRVRVKKPEAPINLDFDYVGVDITRYRGDFNA